LASEYSVCRRRWTKVDGMAEVSGFTQTVSSPASASDIFWILYSSY
jgi:hypothetical protein